MAEKKSFLQNVVIGVTAFVFALCLIALVVVLAKSGVYKPYWL